MFARGVIVLLCVLVAVSDGARVPNCKLYPSKICPEIYKPVCGSDGKTYSNECALCVANKASNTKILIQKEGECDRPPQPDCKPYSSYACPRIYEPVCGSDGKTYSNECLLCAANKASNTKILIVKEGECDPPRQPNCKPNPSKICLLNYSPVCGSDGKTYGNECELCVASETSNTKILIVKEGECDLPRQPNCKPYSSYACPRIYEPVCGSDGKTYSNECLLCAANKASNTKILIVKEGECDPPRQPNCKPNPSKICLLNYSPVCGSDGKTYGNECELCIASETSNTKILIVKEGECDLPRQPNCKPYSSYACPRIYKPVCGSDGKTYGNECLLCAANKDSGTEIFKVNDGACEDAMLE